MGNTPGKPHPGVKNKKYLQLRGADRPSPPGKPYLVTGHESAADVLTIRWDPPLKSGGPPITGFLVEHRRTGSPHWVKAAPLMIKATELTLSGLEPGWRYQFRVFAENIVGLSDPSELSEPLTVTLHRSAITPPRFTKELRDTIALENEKVEFVVHFMGQPQPKISWFKDGIEIFSSRRTRILTEQDRSVLTIHQSAICDEGEIKCAATNKAGYIATKAKLTLEAPPSIRLPRQYEDGLLFEIGELIRLKVSIAGLPPPLIFWSHNGESINENERYEIENTDKVSTLRIAEAMRGDRGEYQIKAINKLGTDSASFLVTVTDKPSPPGKAKVVMTLGRSVTLSWNTPDDDGGCKIGNYIVEYYRLGWNVWLKAATSRQLTTVLGDLIEGSEYRFRIKAESPFGVSEPSEESELVFIPDPKRGIIEPAGQRGRSQPREIETSGAPVAARRKKPRSHSSPRTLDDDDEPVSPVRPDRFKLKSPPKTPDELSPRLERKDFSLNKSIFDRESMTRELAYGTPDIKIKKTDVIMPEIIPNEKAAAPIKPNSALQASIKNTVPIDKAKQKPVISKEKSPEIIIEKPVEIVKEVKEDDNKLKTPQFKRENSETMGGSTEFMMVLYPSETNKDMENASEFGFDFESKSVAPPLSLSAPELGYDPPIETNPLRLSASSSEILHERAMVRFYQEALAEEENIRRKQERLEEENKLSAIPKIQINNKDHLDVIGLERKHSLRRRSGGTMPQQLLWAQRRHSWRKSNEFSDLFDSEVPKNSLTVEEKREIMQNRQRSQSEEKEEEEFERVRQRMAERQTNQNNKKLIQVAQEYSWELEDEENLSDDELHANRQFDELFDRVIDDEQDTYHPKSMIDPKYEQPFEILTKPAKLPDANFIPKPILKKKDYDDEYPAMKQLMDDTDIKEAEESLFKKKNYNEVFPTRRSNIVEHKEQSPPKLELEAGKYDTSAVISAVTAAAGVIISKPMLHQQEEDEVKVVADHYSDLVRNVRQTKTTGLPTNPMREALKKAAALQAALHQDNEEPEEEEELVPVVRKSTIQYIEAIKDKPAPKPSLIGTTISTPKFRPPMMAEPATPLNNKVKEMNERFKAIESKIEEANHRSATPIITASVSTEHDRPKPIARGREQERFTKTNSHPQQPVLKHRKSSPSPAISEKSSRSSSAIKQKRSNSKMRSNTPARSSSKQRKESTQSSRSTSPLLSVRKPKMCEIMTQTSTTVDPFRQPKKLPPTEATLKETAEIKVRSTVDYITDLAMFAVACWLFLFSNELFAIPILLVTVYRQLKDEIKRRMPNWIKKRFNRTKECDS